MNRLIIIGNGFDLAHDLKTNYNSFFNWLWTQEIEKSKFYANFDYNEFVTNCEVINEVFSFSFESYDQLNNNEDIKYLYIDKLSEWENSFYDDKMNTIYINYKSTNSFFSELLIHKHTTKQWADIEKMFFNLLIKESEKPFPKIEVLNKDFEQIKILFEEYLLTINTKNLNLKTKIHREIFYRNGGLISKGIGNENAKILVLNFNYTNTSSIYIGLPSEDDPLYKIVKDNKELLSIDIEINHIHGELNNTNNPIIFGYGDERGEEYKKIELLDNNTFFEHIKSFAYLNTPNYSDLIDFLNTDTFDTILIGHSCGLTDRTLLNTIFEHHNCTSIKPMYYKYSSGGDNYQDIVRNISRNFNDKVKMRNLIVNKTETDSTN